MRSRVTLIAVACFVCVALAGGRALRAEDAKDESKPKSCIPAEKNPERHEKFMKEKEELLKKGPIQLVFDGDSITDGWHGGGKKVWEEHYAKYNPLNLGIGGDRTEHVLWRIEHGELDGISPKVLVLMIGTNNSGSPAREIEAGIRCDVKAIHEKLPNTKILLLAVFPRSPSAKDAIRHKLQEVNDGIAKLNGQDNVTFLDIGQKFLDPEGNLPQPVMHDYLHPTEKGYQIWAEAMGPTLDELMK